MSFYDPRQVLIRNKTSGQDPLVDAILEKREPEYSIFVKASDLKKSPTKKSYLEASLLACKNLEEISSILEIPLPVLTMYRDIYYDVSEMDKLSKLELINISDDDGKAMKTWALSQGMDFIKWRLGYAVNTSPVEGLQELFTTCVYKAKEALFSGNTSESSKESTKWVKLSIEISRLLKTWVLDSAAAKQDLEMALKEIIPNFGSLDQLDEIKDSVDPVDMERALEVPVEVTFESLETLK